MLHGAGIFTNICPKNHPNVGKYTIHGAYGHFQTRQSHINMCIYIYIIYIYILRSSAIPLGQVLQQHGPNAAADLLIPGGKSRKQAFVGTGLPPFPLGVGNQFIPFKLVAEPQSWRPHVQAN